MTLTRISYACTNGSRVSKFGRLCTRCFLQRTSPYYSNKITYSVIAKPAVPRSKFKKDDILLYRYDNQKHFTCVNLTAILFYLYFGNLSYYAATKLYIDEDDDWKFTGKKPWYIKMDLSKEHARYIISFGCAFIGMTIFAVAWIYTVKHVKYLIFNSNKQTMTFITYLPFKKEYCFVESLKDVTYHASDKNKNRIPIKIKNRFIKYLVCKDGEFSDRKLFESILSILQK